MTTHDDESAENPGGMEAIDPEPVTDSEDPGGMSGIPDPAPDKADGHKRKTD